MLKQNDTAKNLKALSQFKFDTSGYVILKDGVRREASSGKFVDIKPKPRKKK